MTQAARVPKRYTVEEYLRIERDATERHEFRDGEIVAMSGGSVNHSLIIMNLGRELGNRVKGGPCRVYDSNLRVRVARGTLYTYPDVTVICGKPVIDPDDRSGESVTNPHLVVEVLSPATEVYNRRTKFDRYRELPSFREYVLVSQDQPRVETYFRREDGTWIFEPVVGHEAVARLRSLDVELPLAEVYAGVEFPPPQPEPEPLR